MEKSTGIVNEGLELGNDLSLALRKISNVVTEVFKFAQEIGAATNEQSHGSSQIAGAPRGSTKSLTRSPPRWKSRPAARRPWSGPWSGCARLVQQSTSEFDRIGGLRRADVEEWRGICWIPWTALPWQKVPAHRPVKRLLAATHGVPPQECSPRPPSEGLKNHEP